MGETVALGDDGDSIPRIIESMYLNVSMASGTGALEQDAYQEFCKNLSHLESVLKSRGVYF